jgi:perosamine synthetase
VHLQPYVRERLGDLRGSLPVTEQVCGRTLALPFHGGMTDQQVEVVASALEAAVAAAR